MLQNKNSCGEFSKRKLPFLMTHHHIHPTSRLYRLYFTPLIGKTVSFELYIGDIGGGHL